MSTQSTRIRSRFLTAMVVLAFVGSIAGCSTEDTVPVFSTPIEWGEGNWVASDGGETVIEDTTATVRLNDNDAWLTDFPQGTTLEDKEGARCFDRSGTELYTGKASWTVLSGYAIQLDFGQSKVVIFAETGYFSDQDWNVIKFFECGKGAAWHLRYKCGNPAAGRTGQEGKNDTYLQPCAEP